MTNPKAKPRGRKRARKTVTEPAKIPGLYYPVALTPEEFFKQLGRTRRDVAAEIERLITFLDNTSGCPDLEDDELHGPEPDDEPSIASTGMVNQERWSEGGNVGVREADCEDEHDGREPDEADLEPSLGRTAAFNQTHSAHQSGNYHFYDDMERGTTRRMTPKEKTARSKGSARSVVITQGGKPYRLDPMSR